MANVAFGLLLPISGNRADDGILLARDAVRRALDVRLGLSGLVLGLAGSMLLLPGSGPRGGAGNVANSLDDGTFDGVELSRDFAGLSSGGVVSRLAGHYNGVE